MTALILLSILLYLLWCRPARRDLFSTGEYMSLERTMMLNGIFITFVVIRHSFGFIPGASHYNEVDALIRTLPRKFGQLIVAGFFFYSGFGIALAVARRGMDYMRRFPYDRFLRLLLRFDIAILCYCLMYALIGHPRRWEDMLLALTGWEVLGNHSWFICATLMLYIVTYLSFRWCGKFRWVALWGGCLLLDALLYVYKPGQFYWYDTLMCFPAGMSFAALRPQIEGRLRKTRLPIPLLGVLLLALAFILHHPSRYNIVTGNISAILFAYGTVLLLAWTEFRKPPTVLIRMGAALFCIYLFHSMPMIIMRKLTDWHTIPTLFFCVTMAATLLLVLFFSCFYTWLDGWLFPSRQKQALCSAPEKANGQHQQGPEQ